MALSTPLWNRCGPGSRWHAQVPEQIRAQAGAPDLGEYRFDFLAPLAGDGYLAALPLRNEALGGRVPGRREPGGELGLRDAAALAVLEDVHLSRSISAPSFDFNRAAAGRYLRPSSSVRSMADDDSRQAKPTAADLAAAVRLQALWEAAVERSRGAGPGRRLVQRVVGDKLGIEQSAVSQYLRGRIRLNYRAVLAFAEAIGCDPSEIRDDLPEQQLRPTSSARADQLALHDLGAMMSSICDLLSDSIPGAAADLAHRMELRCGQDLAQDRLARRLIDTLRKVPQQHEQPSPTAKLHPRALAHRRG
jgi:transcriptional regulator with XRE-family HTH domain